MRRLEALSNTIFGVAMTLLAYDLPKASKFVNAPSWIDLLNAYAQPVIALMISFIVAGVFWLSHHRRLAFAQEGTRGEVFLNLIFLLSIVMLPVTNGLYGVYRLDSVVAASYGVHLIVIAGLNALLWILALRGRSNPELLANAIFPVLVFAVGTATALVAPFAAQIIWGLAFGAPVAGWLAARYWPVKADQRAVSATSRSDGRRTPERSRT
ncbi:MAG: DUF1211 domain-containing protein [Afipia sp.]|nr:DUF1211 domain-containing protein [Afipia sp.]